MKRFHVHVGVKDLAESIRFYSSLFGAEPTVRKADYAKWMLEDPRINFAISTRGNKLGVDHLGIQTDTEEELVALRAVFAAARPPLSGWPFVAPIVAIDNHSGSVDHAPP